MSETPPAPSSDHGGQSAPRGSDRDLADPEQALRAVGETSLRLLAGAVPKAKMEQLRRTVEESAAEFPWQSVTQAMLADPVDAQQLVQQGLVAQRDWILRGGRTQKGPSIARRTKGLVARVVAQLIVSLVFVVVIFVALVLVKHKFPEFDIDEHVLKPVLDLFPSSK